MKKKGSHLFSKLLSCFKIEVSSQASQQTYEELSSLIHGTEVWQSVENCTH